MAIPPTPPISDAVLDHACLEMVQGTDSSLDLARYRSLSRGGIPEEAIPAAADPKNRFESYLLVREIGTGGAGRVCKAWDTVLCRWVAIKFLRLDTPSGVDRLLREAQVAARLNHPGIVKVHAVGTREGQPYLVLQYIDRPEEAAAPDLRRALEIVRDAARAVHHAHENGIMHRDLKPGNLLVDRRGVVHVADFGLARQIEGGAGATIPGTVLGTPAYMSPEQARGESKRVGPATDIYSLGATLYEFCCGRPPYTGEAPAEVLARVLSEEPSAPRALRPELSRELEAVLLQAMAREPERRYPTAAALAADLENLLRGDPIAAHPASLTRRFRSWSRRPVSRAIVSTMLTIVAAVVAVILLRGRGGEADEAERIARESRRARAADALRPAVQALDLWETWNAEMSPADQDLVERSIQDAFAFEVEFGPAWLEEGRRRWREGDPGKAEEAFTRALEDPASAGTARYYRARVRLERYLSGRRCSYLKVRAGGIEARPLPSHESPDDRKLRESAMRDLEEFSRSGVGAADPRVSYARALEGLARASTREEYAACAAGMSAAIESLRVPRWEGYYVQGIAFFYAGRPGPAVEAFDRSIESGRRRQPDVWNERARALLARSEGGEKFLPEALRSVTEALRLDGTDPDAWYLRGIVLAVLARTGSPDGYTEAAIEAFTRSLALDDRAAEIWYNRAVARGTLGEQELMVGRDPRGNLEGAIADFSEAIARDPGHGDARTYRACAQRVLAVYLLQIGEDPETVLQAAIDDATTALEIDPDSRDARITRGTARAMRCKTDGADDDELSRAEEDFTFFLERRPSDPVPRLSRGKVRLQQRRWKEAREDLECAREMSPALAVECERMIRYCMDRENEK